MKPFLITTLLLFAQPSYADDQLTTLGRALFFDTNLSLHRNQSCATCHEPQFAFTDGRNSGTTGALSLGSDGKSLTTRNSPSLSYVAQNPDFHTTEDGELRGGFFYDGRAPNLARQAQEPLFNPQEMALQDGQMLRDRIQENSYLTAEIASLFSQDTLTDPNKLTHAIGQALAAYQQNGEEFQRFSSRFDRYQRGELELDPLEERGRLLFFSNLVNCTNCHQLNTPERETFTDYSYHNIGLPRTDQDATDLGLSQNPAASSPDHHGKFKVPSLRNVAVTAPYMHNGSMAELRTVLVFYNTYLINTPTNPETGRAWGDAEVTTNISHDLLSQGQPLSEPHIDALMAFLRALTDQRYEHLLDDS